MSQITDYVATGERVERDEEIGIDQREHLQQNAPSASMPRDEDVVSGPLLTQESTQDLRSQWDRIQAGFVDDPRSCVKQADELVANAIGRLSESFTQQRSTLEGQWSRGQDVSTEDLRLALRKYRAFFQRLLAA
jgi:hypothetical protein